ncbi:MAG: MBL fold metallo-hydrolase [Planctomycetota bacterium]|nr:MBL fold metallo-hydrolase [Planctomycetota bacterium]
MPNTPHDCLIHTIDTNWLGQPHYTAVYLLEAPEGLCLIETGPHSATENVVAGLHELGHKPEDIDHVLVSHIHLDHAGAAWWWAQQGAMIHAHEFGARHLINPVALLKSATRIYGDRMDQLWGSVEPIDESRMNPVHGDAVLELAGLSIRAIETPGHARHHHAFAFVTQEHGSICFTGDVGAMIMPKGDYIAVPTPPPDFDLDAWLVSLHRLQAENFDAIFPTHFGIHEDPSTHFRRLSDALTAHSSFVGDLMTTGASQEAIYEKLVEWQRVIALEQGTPESQYREYVIDHLMAMNVTGLMRYWSKKREA